MKDIVFNVSDKQNGQLLAKAKKVTITFDGCAGAGHGSIYEFNNTNRGTFTERISRIPVNIAKCRDVKASITDGKQTDTKFLLVKNGVVSGDNLMFTFPPFTGEFLFPEDASTLLQKNITQPTRTSTTNSTTSTTTNTSDTNNKTQTNTKQPVQNKNKYIYIVLGVLAVAGLGYYFLRNKK